MVPGVDRGDGSSEEIRKKETALLVCCVVVVEMVVGKWCHFLILVHKHDQVVWCTTAVYINP